MHRFRPGAGVFALVLLLFALPARALGRVIPSSDGPAQLDALRVAVAFSPHQTTLWTAFRLSGSAQRVAVVLQVAPGSLVDPSSEAWLRALEGATAPRVTAPSGMPECAGGSSNQVESTADDAPAATLHPVEVAVLDTPADLDAFASQNQLALSPADHAALDIPGQRLLALLYALPSGAAAFTQTLRISEPVELASLPLALPRSGSGPIPFTLWTIASGRARLSPGKELAPADVKAVWHEFDGNSDYVQRRHDLLSSGSGAWYLRESSGNSRLFGWTLLPGQGGSVPPATDGYFGTAAQLGDTTSDPANCVQSAAQARVAGSIGMPVADACAPGLLARVPLDGGADPTCVEQPASGSVDPDSLRCGGADDLALALSGLRADKADLTRLEGLLGLASPDTQSIDVLTPAPRSPRVVASKLDSSGCQYLPSGGSGGSSSWGTGGSGGYSGYSGSGGYGGYSGYGGYGGSYASSSGGDVNIDMSCSNSGGDSCSGDSSSSSGDSCSGDSSSSSDGSTCAGDSSSSSDGSTCSGDSSSSSDGATCSGDSSGADGATCSGDSGSSSSCSLSPGRHAHLSVWALGLAAVLLPFRRLSRRRQRGRTRRRRRRVVHAGRRLW